MQVGLDPAPVSFTEGGVASVSVNQSERGVVSVLGSNQGRFGFCT